MKTEHISALPEHSINNPCRLLNAMFPDMLVNAYSHAVADIWESSCRDGNKAVRYARQCAEDEEVTL